MISREDAHEKLHFGNKLDYMSFNDLHEGIEEIYDSIGSCGECSWLEKDTGKSYYDCIQIGIRLMPDRCNNFFCADFERKEQ